MHPCDADGNPNLKVLSPVSWLNFCCEGNNEIVREAWPDLEIVVAVGLGGAEDILVPHQHTVGVGAPALAGVPPVGTGLVAHRLVAHRLVAHRLVAHRLVAHSLHNLY